MQPCPQNSTCSLRRFAWPAARVFVILLLFAGATSIPARTALAAGTYTVNRTDDIAPRGTGGTCNNLANDCTLREAVIKANANSGSTIQFSASINGTPIVLTRTGNDSNASAGDLDINASTNIVGNGSSNTIIQGAANASYTNSIGDKVFGVNQDGFYDSLTVHFSSLTIRYGDNTVPNLDPTYAYTGGGVDVFQTGLNNVATFTDCVISFNRSRTSYGGGLNLDQGGISSGYPVDATGSLVLTNVTFDHNQTMANDAQATGGGLNIFGVAPVVTISDSTFTNNSTPTVSLGGAIYYRPSYGGSLTVGNSVFSGNSSGTGGAISAFTYGTGTTVTIQNSRITGNTASSVGGGLSLGSNDITTTPFQLTNLLISGNTAATHGGGLSVGNSKVTLANSRIVNNTATSDAASKGLYKNAQATTVTATNNWWGCSTGPAAAPCDTASVASGGTLTYNPWFRDRLTAAASPLVTNQSTTLTASFLTNSAGTAVPVSNLAQIIGLPVSWGATLGTLTGTDATVQTTGTAGSNFQATGAGTAIIYARVDSDNTSGASSNVLSLTINKANTTVAITSDTPDPSLAGQAVTVSFTVTGAQGNSPTAPTGNVTVSDSVNNCTGTVAAGSCNITLTTAGPRTLTATYAGDANFNGSASAGQSHTVTAMNTYAEPAGNCSGNTPCFTSVQQALDSTANNGSVTVFGTHNLAASLISANSGANNVTLSGTGTLNWTGGAGALFTIGSGNVTIKGLNLSNAPVVFNRTGSGSLTAYANNITAFTTAYAGAGAPAIGHNYWGTTDPVASAPTGMPAGEWNMRLGAARAAWAEGTGSATLTSGANTASLSGGGGTAVIVSYGRGLANAPFGNGILPFANQMCSDYYDFFTVGGSGTWAGQIPVDNTVNCNANTLTPKRVAWITTLSSCSPSTNPACWEPVPTTSLTVNISGQNLVISGLTVAQLGGTPFVAGDIGGADPTAITLREIRAGSIDKQSGWVIALVSMSVLGLSGVGWALRRRAASKI